MKTRRRLKRPFSRFTIPVQAAIAVKTDPLHTSSGLHGASSATIVCRSLRRSACGLHVHLVSVCFDLNGRAGACEYQRTGECAIVASEQGMHTNATLMQEYAGPEQAALFRSANPGTRCPIMTRPQPRLVSSMGSSWALLLSCRASDRFGSLFNLAARSMCFIPACVPRPVPCQAPRNFVHAIARWVVKEHLCPVGPAQPADARGSWRRAGASIVSCTRRSQLAVGLARVMEDEEKTARRSDALNPDQ